MAISCIWLDVSADSRLKNTPDMRPSSSPLRSMATIVFSKVAGSGLFTIVSISARFTAIAKSNAGS